MVNIRLLKTTKSRVRRTHSDQFKSFGQFILLLSLRGCKSISTGLARIVFIVMLVMCNLQPRSVPVWFSGDIWPTVIIFLFAVTNGQVSKGSGPSGYCCTCPHPARAGFGAEPNEPIQSPDITQFNRAANIYIFH